MNISCILLGLFFVLPTWATPHPASNITVCLAKEEEFYHKKKLSNPNYELNQKLLGEVIQLKNIYPKEELGEQICALQSTPTRTKAPSVKLLELLIIHQEGLFSYSETLSKIEKELAKSHIRDFLSELPELFFQYLSSLQATLSTPDCLEKSIPAIKELNQQMKFLGAELNQNDLIRKYAPKIFSALSNIEKIEKKCLEEKQAKEKKAKTANSSAEQNN